MITQTNFRDDYPKGQPVRLLWNGQPGTVISWVRDTNNLPLYTLKMADGYMLNAHSDAFAAADHPWHDQMDKWRKEGLDRGFNCILVGFNGTAWKAFYGHNGPDDYNRLKAEQPEVKIKYQWRLTV